MGKKIESILSDYWIIFLSTCGLIFIAISTYTLFRPKILADDEVINQIEDLNNENEGNVELRRTPRVKEKDHLKKKELFRLARLKAKQDLSQYKEACKESQLSNRRNVVGQGMDMEYDVTVDDILKYFNASTEVSELDNGYDQCMCSSLCMFTPCELKIFCIIVAFVKLIYEAFYVTDLLVVF